MNSNNHHSTRETLMERIRAEEVHMRPRYYFALRFAGFVVLTTLILLISIFLASLISFDLRLNGHDSLFSFGWRGIGLIIHTFPWWLLAVDIGLVLVLRILLREFSFGYRHAWLPIVFALILISSVAGASLDYAIPFNDRLLERADREHLPGPLNALYMGERHEPRHEDGEYRGIIEKIDGSLLYLAVRQNATNTPLIVHVPADGPDGAQEFFVGEAVFVLGVMDDGVVQAFGVHPLDINGVPHLPPPPNEPY